MMSETAWTRKEYPAEANAENELWDTKDLQEAQKKEKELAAKCHLIWSAENTDK